MGGGRARFSNLCPLNREHGRPETTDAWRVCSQEAGKSGDWNAVCRREFRERGADLASGQFRRLRFQTSGSRRNCG